MIAGSDYLRSIVSSPWTCTTVSPKHSAKKAMKRRRLGIPEPPMFRGMCHNQRTGRGRLKKGVSRADCNFAAACPLGHTIATHPIFFLPRSGSRLANDGFTPRRVSPHFSVATGPPVWRPFLCASVTGQAFLTSPNVSNCWQSGHGA
jgi:hypothetical protein